MLPASSRNAVIVAVALALAACSGSPARQDRQNAGEARSLLAEWAMVVDLHQKGRLNDTYYAGMREAAEKALTRLASTAPQSGSPEGQAIARIAAVHGEPPLALFRARAGAAKAVEDRLEAR